MNDNITCKIVEVEVQKKIVNYLYQEGEITIGEYELLISKGNEKKMKLYEELKQHQDKYSYPIKVDIIL